MGFEQAKPITIGDNVWIGGNVIVLPGVKIGSNCTIGAGRHTETAYSPFGFKMN